MPTIAPITEPVAEDLARVCRIFDDELFSDLPVVNDLCGHVARYRGKMLRPTLLLLSARACGNLNDAHLTLAAVVEMVHMATLVHDDVLDEADMRRRSPTINRLHGNEAAVLLGDYLISHAYHLCSSIDSQFAARFISSTTNTVCEGELQQIHHRGDLDLTIEQYLQIITRKTATLIGACCRLGAQYAEAEQSTIDALERFGTQAGIAFQITDDVLDIIGSEQQMGKTLGRDIDKCKLTLPVIHGLQTAEDETKQRLREALTAHTIDRKVLAGLLHGTGSLTFALDAAKQYVNNALDCLKVLPDSTASESLARLARMIIDRRN